MSIKRDKVLTLIVTKVETRRRIRRKSSPVVVPMAQQEGIDSTIVSNDAASLAIDSTSKNNLKGVSNNLSYYDNNTSNQSNKSNTSHRTQPPQ